MGVEEEKFQVTYDIINLSESENLGTIMYANEAFDSNHPDTFLEKTL